MFHYTVWYIDEIFNESCRAEGRVKANSMTEAKLRIKEFYPNVTYVSISSIIYEDNFSFGKEEWDI